MAFTPAQESAIHAMNPSLLISAAAGSGKTAVLIERIYALLKDGGYSLDRMLVCTFTHAAASEMRERLEGRLAEAVASEMKKKPGERLPENEIKALQRQLDLIETAQISTLHSFCQKLVREHFEAVSIDPQAALCDETTRARLKRAAMEECMNESYEKALLKEETALQCFLQSFTQNEILSILETLHEFLMAQPNPFEWLSHCAKQRYTEEDLRSGTMADTLLADCRILLDGAAALLMDAQAVCESPHCRDKYRDNLLEDGLLLASLQDAAQEGLLSLMRASGSISFGRLASYRLTDEDEIAVRDQFKALRERYKELLSEMSSQLPADAAQALSDLNAMQPALEGLAQMLRRMHELFMEMKSERGLIDFSDLEHMALEILAKPELQKKIAARFDAVFVDEYQDISAIQESILQSLRWGGDGGTFRGSAPKTPPRTVPLEPTIHCASRSENEQGIGNESSCESTAKATSENAENNDTSFDCAQRSQIMGAGMKSLPGLGAAPLSIPVPPVLPSLFFYVGDVKQSIYRFRQADPTLFMKKQAGFSAQEDAEERKITLNHNFRSRESILSAVNRVFAHVMRPEVTEIDYDEDARLNAGLASAGDEAPELHILDGAGLRAADKPAAEAALIAQEINRRVGQPMLGRDGAEVGKNGKREVWHYRDMVILLPAARGIAPTVEKALTEAGIPVYCEDGNGSMESPEIRQALAHLKLLDNVMDDLSLLAALRGPLYGMTEDELAQIRLCKPESSASFLDAMIACANAGEAGAQSAYKDNAEQLGAFANEEESTEEKFSEEEALLDNYSDSPFDCAQRSQIKGAGMKSLPGFRGSAPDVSPVPSRCRAILADLARERFLQRSMALDEYLWGFLSRSGMYGFYGAQPGGKLRQANLRMLCVKAGEHQRNRGGDLRDFLTSVTALDGVRDGSSPTILSPWEDVVRIMTIHKSKGLEFPLVFLMGLGGALHRKRDSGLLAMHPKLGIALKYINQKSRTKRSTLLASAISLRQRAEEKAERARVLYVALTRAKDQLIAIGTGPKALPAAALAGLERRGTASDSDDTPSRGEAYAVWEAKSMLEWLCQCLQLSDEIREFDGTNFSTPALWKTEEEALLSTNSTCFPRKTGGWRVVFHITPDADNVSEDEDNPAAGIPEGDPRAARLEQLLQGIERSTATETAKEGAKDTFPASTASAYTDPIAPPLGLHHAPLKLGVTAYLRQQASPVITTSRVMPDFASSPDLSTPQASPVFSPSPTQKLTLPSEDDEIESIEQKRLPLSASQVMRPRLLSDLPSLPAYLREPEEQTGILRGIAAHKALSLLPLEPLAELLSGLPQSSAATLQSRMRTLIESEMALMQLDGRMTPEECEYTDADKLARFFAAPLGQRVLRSPEVHREWSFNLYAPDLCESLLQGVIDLCFLEDGGWVLVDYKTDRVGSAEELWKTYGGQMAIYRRALTAATKLPVRETALFALSLGTLHSVTEAE